MKNIFNHQLILSQRQKIAYNFDNFNFLHNYCAKIIFDKLKYVKKKYKKAYLLNCLNTDMESLLLSIHPQIEIIHIESSYNFIQNNPEKNIKHIDIVTQDLPLDEDVDLVISLFNMAYLNDLDAFLSKIYNTLSFEGTFIAVTFDFDTLKELEFAMRNVELDTLNQFSNHIYPFLDTKSIGNALSNNKFQLILSDCNNLNVKYSSFYGMIDDIRGFGFSNVLNDRYKKIYPKIFFEKVEAFYKKEFYNEQENFFPVTFNINCCLGWKINSKLRSD